MHDQWLYENLPQAEKRQITGEKIHSFSPSFEKRMNALLSPNPMQTAFDFAKRSAAVLLAAVCVSSALLFEPVRGFVGDVFVRETVTNTVIQTGFASEITPQQIPVLPVEIAGKYYDPLRTKNDVPPRYADSVVRWYTYALDGEPVFDIVQDGREGETYFFEVDSDEWNSVFIDQTCIRYAVQLQFFEKEQRGYQTVAYWYTEHCLYILEGNLNEDALFEVIDEIFMMERKDL